MNVPITSPFRTLDPASSADEAAKYARARGLPQRYYKPDDKLGDFIFAYDLRGMCNATT